MSLAQAFSLLFLLPSFLFDCSQTNPSNWAEGGKKDKVSETPRTKSCLQLQSVFYHAFPKNEWKCDWNAQYISLIYSGIYEITKTMLCSVKQNNFTGSINFLDCTGVWIPISRFVCWFSGSLAKKKKCKNILGIILFGKQWRPKGSWVFTAIYGPYRESSASMDGRLVVWALSLVRTWERGRRKKVVKMDEKKFT